MNDPMVDSGKASDISVSSWPMEPIQWTPFPLLHQLSRQRPVSRACRGSGFGFWLLCMGAGVQAGRGDARGCSLSSSIPGRETAVGAPEGSGGSHQLLPGWRAAAPLGVQDKTALSTAQSQTASLVLRGDGAGQPGEELDSLKTQSKTRATRFSF